MDSNCNIQRIFKFSITKTNKFIVIFYGSVVNDIYLLASNENNIKSITIYNIIIRINKIKFF